MKICITSKGDNINSLSDPLFGRCKYFLIIDTDNDDITPIENPNINQNSAGILSAKIISEKDVQMVLSGNIGPNAFKTLEASGIKVITGVSGSINEILNNFKNDKYKFVDAHNTDQHSGIN